MLKLVRTVVLGIAVTAACCMAQAAAQSSTTQSATTAATGRGELRVLFSDAAGTPIPAREILEFHCRDMDDEALITECDRKDGVVTVVLPRQAIQLSALIPVPEFGTVTLYADGRGRGYETPASVNFITEAAATRHQRVQDAAEQARREGLSVSREFMTRLNKAGQAGAYESLAATLRLGEELTLARARFRIEHLRHPRKDFLFGCNAFRHPAGGAIYDQRFRELFNYGTANLYLSRYAPAENTRDFARPDLEVQWLRSSGMTAKLCPPIYLARGVTPEWLQNHPWDQTRRICHDLMGEVCRRYAGQVPFCEIVNEAHDYSNSLALSPEQLTELADVCSKAASEGDPALQRIINCCHLWGEYASRPGRDGKPRRSPYRYMSDCIRSGVKLEIVGLQMYYPEYDLFEINRMLDRYARLGKPIHITEMGCSSAPGIDPNAQRKKASAGWHGPWTEEMQADWVEGVYTIFYSKPYITAVSWWDLADAVSFWPYGGLLRPDMSPKPGYTRLKAQLGKWGVGRRS